MFTRPVSNSDITDFIIDRLDNVKTPDCHVYSKNFLDYMAPIHKVSFVIWSIFFIFHIMLSLSLIDIMLIFITHFYQHTFDNDWIEHLGIFYHMYHKIEISVFRKYSLKHHFCEPSLLAPMHNVLRILQFLSLMSTIKSYTKWCIFCTMVKFWMWRILVK